jgi:hypothetical protein
MQSLFLSMIGVSHIPALRAGRAMMITAKETGFELQ